MNKLLFWFFDHVIFLLCAMYESVVCCDVMSEKDTNAYHLMTEICGNILRRDSKLPPPLDSGQPGKKIEISKPAANLCRNEILKQCGVDVLLLLKENAAMTKEYKKSLNQIRSFNTSHCLKISYGVDVVEEIGLARMTKGPFSSPSKNSKELGCGGNAAW